MYNPEVKTIIALVHLQISKAVYASTTKSQLNLNNQRASEHNPTVTYPDISFAVENFEEAFESLVGPFYCNCP